MWTWLKWKQTPLKRGGWKAHIDWYYKYNKRNDKIGATKICTWWMNGLLEYFKLQRLDDFVVVVIFIQSKMICNFFYPLLFFQLISGRWIFQQCTKCDELSTYGSNDGFVNFDWISTVHIHQNNNNPSADTNQQWHGFIKIVGQINGQYHNSYGKYQQ